MSTRSGDKSNVQTPRAQGHKGLIDLQRGGHAISLAREAETRETNDPGFLRRLDIKRGI